MFELTHMRVLGILGVLVLSLTLVFISHPRENSTDELRSLLEGITSEELPLEESLTAFDEASTALLAAAERGELQANDASSLRFLYIDTALTLGARAAEEQAWGAADAVLGGADRLIDALNVPWQALEEQLTPEYFELRANVAIMVAVEGDESSDALITKLAALLEQAVAVADATEVTPELRSLVAGLYTAQEASLGHCQGAIRTAVLAELSLLALLLDNIDASLSYMEAWTMAMGEDGAPELFTLAELQDHPHVARFNLEGTGNYRAMRIHFTYVAEPIRVVILPMILRYTGGENYQSMGLYRVEHFVVAEPGVKTVPAVCLDYQERPPADGLSDFAIEQLGDSSDGERAELIALLLTLQTLELHAQRLAELGLTGEWDTLVFLPESLREQLFSLIVWNHTDRADWPATEVEFALAFELFGARQRLIRDYLEEELEPPGGIAEEDYDSILQIIASLILLNEDWEATLRELERSAENPSVGQLIAGARQELTSSRGEQILHRTHGDELAKVAELMAWLEQWGIDWDDARS